MKEPHAIVRARQRYGLTLTCADLSEIAAEIQSNKGRFLGWGDNGTVAFRLKWRGTLMRVLLDKDIDTIVTFLPVRGRLMLTKYFHPMAAAE